MEPLNTLIAGLRGTSVRKVAETAGIPRRSVQGVLDGHIPSLTRAAEICSALGLELYIGPSREARSVNTPENSQIAPLPPDLERHTQGLVRAVAAAGGDPLPADLRHCAQCGRIEADASPRRSRPDRVRETSPPD